jgi:RsiW-degrading membrane proteinase PrsW (M82 family)
MSKKVWNPQRRRFIALIATLYAATYALWAFFYSKAADAARAKMLVVIIFTSCFGFLGVGIIIALYYRFPVEKDEEKDSN